MEKVNTVDEYIYQQPETHREKLKQMRDFMLSALPFAYEVISYSMPMYKYHGMLVGFGYLKAGVSFYACSTTALSELKDFFEGYNINVSALHIKLNQPIPEEGIKKVIAMRKLQNEEKEALKKDKKQGK
jgi:uncharacterized protein YdhG (YjbR/CyaY superfamily)